MDNTVDQTPSQAPSQASFQPSRLNFGSGEQARGADNRELRAAAAFGRRAQRDRNRTRRGTPLPDRTHYGHQPGDDGYVSSDEENAVPPVEAMSHTIAKAIAEGLRGGAARSSDWKRKADYKRAMDAVKQRADNIKHKLGDGVISDAAFFHQLRNTVQGEDFRQAVRYAESVTSELGADRPPAEGLVSGEAYDNMVRGYMIEHHSKSYLDASRAALLQSVSQHDDESGARYKLRELQRYKGVEYLFKDRSVGERERANLQADFVAAWIQGLLDEQTVQSLATGCDYARLDGKPWSLTVAANKAAAHERRDKSPRKRVRTPVVPHHSQTPADDTTARLDALQATIASMQATAPVAPHHSQAPADDTAGRLDALQATIASMQAATPVAPQHSQTPTADTPARLDTMQSTLLAMQAAMAAQMAKNGQGGATQAAPPYPPPVCRTCQERGEDPYHTQTKCPHAVCHVCDQVGHTGAKCTLPCPGCQQTSYVDGKRHRPGCFRIPTRRKQQRRS